MIAVIIGIPRGAVVWIEAGDVDADLVHVRLADEQRARGAEAGDDGGVFFRARSAEELRSNRGGIASLVHLVLYSDRNAVEGAERPVGSPPIRGGARECHQVIAIDGDERSQRWRIMLAPVTLCKKPFGDLLRGGMSRAVRIRIRAHVRETESPGFTRRAILHPIERRRRTIVCGKQWEKGRRFRNDDFPQARKPAVALHLLDEKRADDRILQERAEHPERTRSQSWQGDRPQIVAHLATAVNFAMWPRGPATQPTFGFANPIANDVSVSPPSHVTPKSRVNAVPCAPVATKTGGALPGTNASPCVTPSGRRIPASFQVTPPSLVRSAKSVTPRAM